MHLIPHLIPHLSGTGHLSEPGAGQWAAGSGPFDQIWTLRTAASRKVRIETFPAKVVGNRPISGRNNLLQPATRSIRPQTKPLKNKAYFSSRKWLEFA